MFCALAFLPQEDVIEAFQNLSEDDDIPIEFVSYFELNYIGVMRGRTTRENPLYPVSFWNVKKDPKISQEQITLLKVSTLRFNILMRIILYIIKNL